MAMTALKLHLPSILRKPLLQDNPSKILPKLGPLDSLLHSTCTHYTPLEYLALGLVLLWIQNKEDKKLPLKNL